MTHVPINRRSIAAGALATIALLVAAGPAQASTTPPDDTQPGAPDPPWSRWR